jgi:hypothetical protein
MNISRSIIIALFPVSSSTNDLVNLSLGENHKLFSFDIKDLFVNIHIEETLVITKFIFMPKQNNELQTTDQILNLMKLVISQIYFILINKIYQPEKGVAVGSPLSSTVD